MMILGFTVVPLVVLLGSAIYALVIAYRLQDWRPLLFIAVLCMMAIHQLNELNVSWTHGAEAALAGIGEYPETAANVLASLGTVMLLRWVAQEQQLAQRFEERVQERTAELESFTYSVSHDLRTPLRTIDAFSNMLRDQYADRLDAEGQRFVRVISDTVARMGHLVDDLLALTRLGRKDMQRSTVDMGALVRSVLDELERTHPEQVAALTITIEALPSTTGDWSMIRQVYMNLLSNALKFTRQKDDPQITIGSLATNGTVVYYVKDNGVGFDMRYADKLFGVFERLHDDTFDGTGVGLAIAERVIERHDGRIWARGAEGEGATFFFTLQ